MTEIKIYYRDGKTDIVDVFDYSVAHGWLVYASNVYTHPKTMIPADLILKVERL
jgi:hypothetical protein